MIRNFTDDRPDIDIIIVHYHAARGVADAVAALRNDAATASLTINVTVADNGSTNAEREILASLDVTVLPMERNAGYAAAINAAVPLTTAEILVVMNEDVQVQAGCLEALRHALLHDDAAVAGPKFFWDAECTFILPCTEERSRSSELRKVASRKDLLSLERARRSWRARAKRFWTADSNTETVSLSGALIALRRNTWEAAGPFDSGFFLYYEEDDWLHRVRESGLRCVYVPSATAIHLHDASLGSSEERSTWEAESFVRFGNRFYGEQFMRRLQRLSKRPVVTPEWGEPLVALDLSDLRAPTPLWVELTPSPFGYPAAAMPLDPSRDLTIMPQLRGPQFRLEQPLYIQIVDDEGNELRRFRSEVVASERS